MNGDRDASDYKEQIKEIVRNSQWQLFRSIRFHMIDYIKGIESLYWHSNSQIFYYIDDGNKIYPDNPRFEDLLTDIEVVLPHDKIDLFLFKLYFATATHIGYGTQYDFIEPMLRRTEKLIGDFKKVIKDSGSDIFDDKPMAVIHIGDVNKDIKEILPSIIANLLFSKQTIEKGDDSIKSIVNIVIDEAHNLLYEDDYGTKHRTVTIETFEKIVKEGRKYGVFLWVASQRPADISSTILSQLHNYFIHKLVNPLDINKIRKSVAYLNEESIDMITVLGPGECVLSGTSVNTPLFMKVDQVEMERRPNSENVILTGERGIFN